MLTCNVVKDLLPNYADGLVNEKTSQEIEEHLSGCADCKTEYEEIKSPLALITDDVNEIDYLKKIKRENVTRIIKYSVISVFAASVIFIISVFVFYIGKPVNSGDFSYSLHKDSDGYIRIEMILENGYVLHAQPNYDNININEVVCAPRQSLKIPFDDMGEYNGSRFSWGYGVTGTNGKISDDFKFIFRFADKEVVLTIDDFPN